MSASVRATLLRRTSAGAELMVPAYPSSPPSHHVDGGSRGGGVYDPSATAASLSAASPTSSTRSPFSDGAHRRHGQSLGGHHPQHGGGGEWSAAGAGAGSEAGSVGSRSFDGDWDDGTGGGGGGPDREGTGCGGGGSVGGGVGPGSPHGWIDDWSAPLVGGPRAGRAAGRRALRTSLLHLHAPGSSAADADGGAGVPPGTPRDGIVAALGRGRGYCNDCAHAVCLYKSYWRCACGAWSFNAAFSVAKTRAHFAALLAFLDELYVTGTFRAGDSPNVVMALRPRSALPAAHPPDALAAVLRGGDHSEGAQQQRAEGHPRGKGEAEAGSRGGGGGPGASSDGGAARVGAALPLPDGSGRRFAPLPAPFVRGCAFLLE